MKRWMKSGFCEFINSLAPRGFINLICYLFRPTDVDGLNDIALITCSSGTTGMSKGETFTTLVKSFTAGC